MVDWGNPQDVIDLCYGILDAVNTYQKHPQSPDYQPISENPHCRKLAGEPELERLIENLCESKTCPLQRTVKNGCECFRLDSSDINSFIATLEQDNENPYEWD